MKQSNFGQTDCPMYNNISGSSSGSALCKKHKRAD